MSKQQIKTEQAPSPGGAYSQGLRVGDFLFTAGMGPWHPVTRQVVGETIEEQTIQTLENLQAVLEAGGARLSDVVKTTVHLSDLDQFAAFNQVYSRYFPDPKPVRTTVGSQLLGILVEIDAIAYLGELTVDREALLSRLRIPAMRLEEINAEMFTMESRALSNFLDVVESYGSPEEINRKATAAGQLAMLEAKVRQIHPEYLDDLEWLRRQAKNGTYVSITAYRQKILGERFREIIVNENSPVTLEISACQYFPWLMDIAHQALENGEIMPGRFIRVRNMQEQEADGDLPAFAAAMQIIGASYVEQLDTRGSDGSNIHLGGADTLVGYYGGVGEPNEYALKWLDEYLYYYTTYGVRQVLNVNQGTVLLGYLLYRLGIDIQFKISVTLGNDNPYNALWTLLTARLFAREDGSTPLVGLNWSNSVNNETIEISAQFRKSLGLEDLVRFEHHVTETWKGLVIQPYFRRQELLELAGHIANLSAKHEGGEPDLERKRERPSDVQDYFRTKDEILASGDWDNLTINFRDKFEALNLTARALTERGLSFIAASNLHHP